MPSAWISYVKEFRTNHPDLSYKQALKEASKSYQGKKEAVSTLKKIGEKAKVVTEKKKQAFKTLKHIGEFSKQQVPLPDEDLKKKLEECESEKTRLLKQLEEQTTTQITTPTISTNINDLSLVEQVKQYLDYMGDKDEFLHQIKPKRRSQIRNIIAKAQKEGKSTGLIGELLPVLNKITSKYEIDPARSKKSKTGFKTQKEMDDFIDKRIVEIATEEESRPPLNIGAVKLKKRKN